MKLSEHRTQSFLVVRYDRTGFLIDRDRCVGSSFLGKTPPLDQEAGYLAGRINHGGRSILVFDLDRRLREIFDLTGGVPGTAAVLMTPGETVRRQLRAATDRLAPDCADDCLALKLPGRTRVARLPLTELRLMPSSLRAKLARAGLLGCRFLPGDRIQYLIDVDRLVSQTDMSTEDCRNRNRVMAEGRRLS